MVVISSGRGPGSWPRPTPADSLIETADTPKMVSRATLICRPNSHPFQERHLALEKPEKIGRAVARVRAAANNAIFDCKVLSRNHALLWYENGKFFLQDTQSSNGTYVNSQRLLKGQDESPPRELFSGDTVQFGVDVMENSKKVTHGCIVATLKLYLPDGQEAKPSVPSTPTPTAESLELCQLHQYVQEAVLREQSVETKLATLQRLMDGVRTATDSSWKASMDEDRLLTRLEMLEGQHALYSKNFGDDKLREELARLQEEKNTYQSVAKESLKKVLQEKLEAVRKLQDVERCLSSAEDESRKESELRQEAVAQLVEFVAKYEAKLVEMTKLEAKVTELEAKVKALEEEAAEAQQRWTAERLQLETQAARERDEAQTREQALQQKLSYTVHELVSNAKVGVRATAESQSDLQSQLVETRAEVSVCTERADRLRASLSGSEVEVAALTKQVSSLEEELAEAQTELTERGEKISSLEQEMEEKQAKLQQAMKLSLGSDTDIKHQLEITRLRDGVTQLTELLTEARQQQRQSQTRLERAETSLLETRTRTTANVQQAMLKADDLRAQLKDAEERLAVLTKREQETQQRLQEQEEAAKELERMQGERDARRLELEETLKLAEKQYQESLSAAECRLAASVQECETLRRQVTELRAESDAVRQLSERRQSEVDAGQSRLQELESRLNQCAAERDQHLLVVGGGGSGEKPDVDDAEKSELRRQLRQMDDQLKQLSLQNRTVETSTLVALAALVAALFVGLLTMSS